MSDVAVLGLRPGELAHGRPYFERAERAQPWYDEAAVWTYHSAVRPLWRALGADTIGARKLVAMTRAAGQGLAALDDPELAAQARQLRPELRRTGFGAAPTARMFAIVREAASRVLGKRHYDAQVHAAWLLIRGSLAEMATGEGKTFAATLAACAAAVAGVPVHVVTVNDYLASRDAESMRPLYAFFGLRCGAIVHAMSRAQRREIYAGDIAYCSNKELVFDYLRDGALLGDKSSVLHRAVATMAEPGPPASADRGSGTVLRGLSLAIVDEADSAFIDEARTPLILSATVAGEGRPLSASWALPRAMALREGVDFRLDPSRMRVRLDERLRALIEQELDGDAESPAAASAPDGLTPRECLDALQQALAALHLYRRDQHYVVMGGRVQIVDESTGRVMADRSWERGLHQMIEAKEGLDLSDERRTLARITYQRFFRRYLRLAGMTGTGLEVAAEIGRVYRLPVSKVPLHRPSRWRNLGARCLPTSAGRWQAVVQSIGHHAVEQGRPVLVGTRTVKASEELSAWLSQAHITHVVLNAKQDAAEADVVARAGQRGAVTVATNMAGRGTDIALGEGVQALGGLHVILTEFHDSARIDRQLFGRAARQGDPGSGEAIVSLEDELFCVHAVRLTKLLAPLARRKGGLPAPALWFLRRVAQSKAESTSRVTRMASLQYDRRLASLLAFSGRGE